MISDPDPPEPLGREEELFYRDEWLDYLLLFMAAGFFVTVLIL